jgi:putative oxidoreductase
VTGIDQTPTAHTPSPWRIVHRIEAVIASIPEALPLLALRFALAVPFFKSGLTKWDGFLTLSNGARYLFTQEFSLHVFGNQYPYPAPVLMATLSGIGEIVLPILLVLGLGTRFAAIGILLMTAVIQLTVPDGWANFHLPWAAMALTLAVYGGGPLALDRAIGLGPRRG